MPELDHNKTQRGQLALAAMIGYTAMKTKFNQENKKQLSYGECLGPAMKITDAKDAKQYFADYVAFIQTHLDREPRDDGKTAADVARINLGYYAGYYDNETRERVERLFKCSHPIFGAIATKGAPTGRGSVRGWQAHGGCCVTQTPATANESSE